MQCICNAYVMHVPQVIWRMEDGMAICGSPASHDSALTLCWCVT